METKEIFNLWSETIDKFGVNDFNGFKIFVNGNLFMDSDKQDIKPAYVRAFMYLVASKQIPQDSVYFEDNNGRKNLLENGKCDYDFGRWFSADDDIALAQFDESEDEY